jgi:TRAP-type mannitol/chloroaromatic compound transport system permease small subunit
MGGAYVLRHKAHINMDLVYSRCSPRTKAILDVIGAIPFFILCFVLLWFGSLFAWESLRQLEPDATIFRAPVYPVKMMMPLAGFLLFLQGLAKICRDLSTAITGREYEKAEVSKIATEGR